MARLEVDGSIVKLDLATDPNALGALKAYASSARNLGDEALADSVEAFVAEVEKRLAAAAASKAEETNN